MSCPDRNQDLLLLTHGELDGIRRALLEQHLRRCSRCRERQQRYGALSTLIAGEVRPHEMPAWSPHVQQPESAQLSLRRLALCIALAILLGVAATAGAVWGPTSWWSFGALGHQSQTIDTSCQSNVPGNIPINPPGPSANQPGEMPAGHQPASAANAPASPDACLTPAPPTPHK